MYGGIREVTISMSPLNESEACYLCKTGYGTNRYSHTHIYFKPSAESIIISFYRHFTLI